MLIDIEGRGFDLLTENLTRFRRCPIVIALRDWLVEHCDNKRTELMERSNGRHGVSVLTGDLRDLSGLPELQTKNDDHHWLICSDDQGR